MQQRTSFQFHHLHSQSNITGENNELSMILIICYLEKHPFQVLSATPNVVNPILYGCLRPDLRKLASDLINGYISTRTSTATANTISFRYTEPSVQKLISNRRASQIKHI